MTKPSNRQAFWQLFHKIATYAAVLAFHFLVFIPISAKGNCPALRSRMSAEEYCKLYAAEAQRQMKLYGIPASITLAQGMFESGYGSSYIAVKGNNHFGIKAYRGWSGPVVRCDDDKSNEPFCKFSSVMEGYEYHSKFLRNNTRYAPLFKLSPKDYKGWAHGLRKCGYATNPKYPQLLIDVIERFHLEKYDNQKIQASTSTSSYASGSAGSHKLYSTGKRRALKYVKAKKNDALSVIAKEFKVKERQLRKWNDLPKKYNLKEGEIIYLQAKKSKADRQHPTHVVKSGETLQSISQQYGVTVSSLVKRNKLRSGTIRRGQVLKLR